MTDIQSLWKNQATGEPLMLSNADLRRLTERLGTRIRWRNLALYAYSLFNVIASLYLIATNQFSNMHAPMLLMVAAHLFVLWQIWTRFGLKHGPQPSGENGLQFYRQELERQHEAVNKAWLWYMMPFMPAFVWELSIWLTHIPFGTSAGTASFNMFIMVVFCAILFWSCVLLLFSRHASRLELEMERVSRVTAE